MCADPATADAQEEDHDGPIYGMGERRLSIADSGGQTRPCYRHRQRAFDRLWMRAVFSAGSGPTSPSPMLNEKSQRLCRASSPRNSAPRFSASATCREPGDLEAVFEQIRDHLGSLDIALHSIAFAPKEDLQGRRRRQLFGRGFSGDGHFLPFVHPHGALAEPLMRDGGTLLA